MHLLSRTLTALATTAAAASVLASPASADTTGPAVKYWNSAIPAIGSVLSDTSAMPSFSAKHGWAVNDADGICSAYTDDANTATEAWHRVWNAPSTGKSVTSLINNTYSWTARVGRWEELRTNAQDCLGNTSTSYGYVSPDFKDQGAASYGSGWSSSAGPAWSGGSVMKSSTVGATANLTFTDAGMISLISDKASSRGKVSLSMDGGTPVTVTLTSSTVANRVIVWNSRYLTGRVTHLLKMKVMSGRVDIDGFLVQSPTY